uniref:Transmembrane protein 138 n=1 Tax=Heterorhabditis bacteriophora TaxID=37862 RepID=A0A1I7X5E8_HETBA
MAEYNIVSWSESLSYFSRVMIMLKVEVVFALSYNLHFVYHQQSIGVASLLLNVAVSLTDQALIIYFLRLFIPTANLAAIQMPWHHCTAASDTPSMTVQILVKTLLSKLYLPRVENLYKMEFFQDIWILNMELKMKNIFTLVSSYELFVIYIYIYILFILALIIKLRGNNVESSTEYFWIQAYISVQN